MIKKYALFALFLVLLPTKFLSAQTSNCFDIESILVDACGTPEGENEMVRFLIGPNPLNTSTLIVDWPNNNWLGVVQNAQTQGIVDTLNQSIQACGYILEPTAGLIPANAEVILVTSSNMNITANSFANLADTIYMVFQAPGNTSGHFKNYSPNSGTRTLIMNFGACADTVTYVVDSLIDQSGLHSAQDGATVIFDFAGNDSYTNPGCQAPIVPLGATLTSGGNGTVCAGDTVSFLASNLTGNYSSFFWTTNGTGTFSSTTTLSTIYQTPAPSSGTDIIFFGMIGLCGDTAYTTISITYTIGVPVSISYNPDTVICNGNSVTLSGVGGTNYLWSTGATTDSIVVTSAGYYTVSSQSACGNSVAGINILVNTTPNVSISASGPTTFCQGQSVTLTASGGSSYSWSTGATTTSITVSASGTYTVTSSNSCGTSNATEIITVNSLPVAQITSPSLTFCQGGSTTLTAGGGTSYLWSTGATTALITVNTAGTFTVTATNNCGSSSTSVTTQVTNQPVAVITPSGPTSFCQGQSVTLTASGGTSFQWSTGVTTSAISVTTTGTYTVTVTDLCGTSSTSVSTTVTNLPTAAISASGPTTFCTGGSVALTASGGGTYQWSTGSTSASITATNAGSYTVTVTNSCGSSSASVPVIVDNAPSASITPGGPTSFCEGGSVTLQGTGTGNFLWSNGATTSSITVSTQGTYSLTATNSCGAARDSILITVFQVNAVATANPSSGAPPLQVNFSSSQSTNANLTFWNFTSTDTTSTANPSFTFNDNGIYHVQLVVFNQQGCTDTAYVDINVNAEQPFFIPNVFTPNDDTKNDVFFVNGSDVKNVSGTIFNRWGNEIVKINSTNGSWNGKNKNDNDCPEGVYYYVFVVNFKNNIPLVEKRGTITLLR